MTDIESSGRRRPRNRRPSLACMNCRVHRHSSPPEKGLLGDFQSAILMATNKTINNFRLRLPRYSTSATSFNLAGPSRPADSLGLVRETHCAFLLRMQDGGQRDIIIFIVLLRNVIMNVIDGRDALRRKARILEAAELVKHAEVWTPPDGPYVLGFAGAPAQVTKYESEYEPHVGLLGAYRLDPAQAWLTVNRYNAVVLNTRNMLIVDVDFGDERLNRFAGASDAAEVIAALDRLGELDETLYEGDLASESYRVYRTHSGCRVICTSRTFSQDDTYFSDRLMQFLKADRQYMQLCKVQKCYRARLTPKPWRVQECFHHVCLLVHKHGPGMVDHDLVEQLAVHDEMTLELKNEDSVLA